jgi:rod shape-determining protein MreD
VLAEFRFLGVSVELLLLVTVLVAFHGGPERGAWVGLAASLIQDALTGAPFGIHALIYAPLALGVSSLEDRTVGASSALNGLGLALVVASGSVLVSIAGLLFGQIAIPLETLGERALVAGFLTALIAKPVNEVIRWSVDGVVAGEIELRNPQNI